jgi:CspA family cold shock protein
MPLGIVKWFNDKRGFGFIKPLDGDEDIFVHYSVIERPGHRTLTEGETVQYEAQKDSSGKKRASYVVPLKKPN